MSQQPKYKHRITKVIEHLRIRLPQYRSEAPSWRFK